MGDFSNLDTAAESVYVRDPATPTGEVRGCDALEERISGVLRAFPDFHTEIEDEIRREGTVTMEWTMTGTHEGGYNGTPPTNRGMEVAGVSTVVVADGTGQENRRYFDTRELLEQLGITEG